MVLYAKLPLIDGHLILGNTYKNTYDLKLNLIYVLLEGNYLRNFIILILVKENV